MTEIRNALAAFWGGFVDRGGIPPANRPVPAWQEDYVPHESANIWPRITYPIIRPDALGSTIISASVWNREPLGVVHRGMFALVDDILRQAAEKIPPGGVLLQWDEERDYIGQIITFGGALWLQRSNPFTDYLADPDDPLITRGIIRVIISIAQ